MMNVLCWTPRLPDRDVQISTVAAGLNAGKQPFVIHVAFVNEEEFRTCLFNRLHQRLSSQSCEEIENLYSCLC